MEKNLAKIREKLGLVHIYAGDGKGKTSAAVGLAVRASGNGLNVVFTQFLKSGTSSELEQLKKLGVEVISGQPINKFVFQMNDAEKAATCEFFHKRLDELFALAGRGEIDLLVLDEILGAISTGMVDEKKLLTLIAQKNPHTELVLTGRGPSEAVIAKADYYSEIVMRKHPYETSGMPARRGIEF